MESEEARQRLCSEEAATVAAAAGVVWGLLKSYPPWPAQVMSEAAAAVHQALALQKRKSKALPVMFFGDKTVAWLDTKEVVAWGEGAGKGYCKGKTKQHKMALAEVSELLERGQMPAVWWAAGNTVAASDPAVVAGAAVDMEEAAPAVVAPPAIATPSHDLQQLPNGTASAGERIAMGAAEPAAEVQPMEVDGEEGAAAAAPVADAPPAPAAAAAPAASAAPLMQECASTLPAEPPVAAALPDLAAGALAAAAQPAPVAAPAALAPPLQGPNAALQPARPGSAGSGANISSARDVLRQVVNRLRLLHPVVARMEAPAQTHALQANVARYFGEALATDSNTLRGKDCNECLAEIFSWAAGQPITAQQAKSAFPLLPHGRVLAPHVDWEVIRQLGLYPLHWKVPLRLQQVQQAQAEGAAGVPAPLEPPPFQPSGKPKGSGGLSRQLGLDGSRLAPAAAPEAARSSRAASAAVAAKAAVQRYHPSAAVAAATLAVAAGDCSALPWAKCSRGLQCVRPEAHEGQCITGTEAAVEFVAAHGDELALAEAWQPRAAPRDRGLPAGSVRAELGAGSLPAAAAAAAELSEWQGGAPAEAHNGVVLQVVHGRIVRPRSSMQQVPGSGGNLVAAGGGEEAQAAGAAAAAALGQAEAPLEPLQQLLAVMPSAADAAALTAFSKRDLPPSYIHIKQNVWVSRPRPRRQPKDEIATCNCRVAHAHQASRRANGLQQQQGPPPPVGPPMTARQSSAAQAAADAAAAAAVAQVEARAAAELRAARAAEARAAAQAAAASAAAAADAAAAALEPAATVMDMDSSPAAPAPPAAAAHTPRPAGTPRAAAGVEGMQGEEEGKPSTAGKARPTSARERRTWLDRQCSHCGVGQTSNWRRHPETRVLLCNYCGSYVRQHATLPEGRKAAVAAQLLKGEGGLPTPPAVKQEPQQQQQQAAKRKRRVVAPAVKQEAQPMDVDPAAVHAGLQLPPVPMTPEEAEAAAAAAALTRAAFAPWECELLARRITAAAFAGALAAQLALVPRPAAQTVKPRAPRPRPAIKKQQRHSAPAAQAAPWPHQAPVEAAPAAAAPVPRPPSIRAQAGTSAYAAPAEAAPALLAGDGRWDGCGDNCLNRLSFFHCDPRTCPCGDRCSNRPFSELPGPCLEVFLTANRGWGVRAGGGIKRGAFVVEYAGEVVDEAEGRRRAEDAKSRSEPHFYMMEMAPGLIIDARSKGNLARLLNSSCNPNCETQKWHDAATGEIRVGIFTLRDILPGEELTYDYKFEQEGLAAAAAYRCSCGAPNCRGTIDPHAERVRDFGRRLEVWWQSEQCYYRGSIIGYAASQGRHTVQYDDGDVERLFLARERYCWLGEGDTPAGPVHEPEPEVLAPRKGLQRTGSAGSGKRAAVSEAGRAGSGAGKRQRRANVASLHAAPQQPALVAAAAPAMAARAEAAGGVLPPAVAAEEEPYIRYCPPQQAAQPAVPTAAAAAAAAAAATIAIQLAVRQAAAAQQAAAQGAQAGKAQQGAAPAAAVVRFVPMLLPQPEGLSLVQLQSANANAAAHAAHSALMQVMQQQQQRHAQLAAAAAATLAGASSVPSAAAALPALTIAPLSLSIVPLDIPASPPAAAATAAAAPPLAWQQPLQQQHAEGPALGVAQAEAAAPAVPAADAAPGGDAASKLAAEPAAAAAAATTAAAAAESSVQRAEEPSAPAAAEPASDAVAGQDAVVEASAQGVAAALHVDSQPADAQEQAQPAAAVEEPVQAPSAPAAQEQEAQAATHSPLPPPPPQQQQPGGGETRQLRDPSLQPISGVIGHRPKRSQPQPAAGGRPQRATRRPSRRYGDDFEEGPLGEGEEEDEEDEGQEEEEESEEEPASPPRNHAAAAEARRRAAAAAMVSPATQAAAATMASLTSPPPDTAAAAPAVAVAPAALALAPSGGAVQQAAGEPVVEEKVIVRLAGPAGLATRNTARRQPAAPGELAANGGRGGRRAAPTPASTGLPARTILVAKKLTNSDVSKGRILLPRAAVEANLSFATGRAHAMTARDHLGRDWEFTLQSWANGMESRRVYVLEHAGDFIRTHALRPEDVIGLSTADPAVQGQDTAFLVEYNTEEVIAASENLAGARYGGGGGGAATVIVALHAAAGSNMLIQQNAGRCTRSEYCNKPAGHPGFCMRTPGAAAAAAARKNRGHSTASAAAAPTAASSLPAAAPSAPSAAPSYYSRPAGAPAYGAGAPKRPMPPRFSHHEHDERGRPKRARKPTEKAAAMDGREEGVEVASEASYDSLDPGSPSNSEEEYPEERLARLTTAPGMPILPPGGPLGQILGARAKQQHPHHHHHHHHQQAAPSAPSGVPPIFVMAPDASQVAHTLPPQLRSPLRPSLTGSAALAASSMAGMHGHSHGSHGQPPAAAPTLPAPMGPALPAALPLAMPLVRPLMPLAVPLQRPSLLLPQHQAEAHQVVDVGSFLAPTPKAEDAAGRQAAAQQLMAQHTSQQPQQQQHQQEAGEPTVSPAAEAAAHSSGMLAAPLLSVAPRIVAPPLFGGPPPVNAPSVAPVQIGPPSDEVDLLKFIAG